MTKADLRRGRWLRHADRSGGANACWPWTAGLNQNGYGQVRVGSLTDGTRRMMLAHRLAYETFIGPLLDGMVVMHRCDNPVCVNPAHLRQGTQKENVHDCLSKGRFVVHSGLRVPPPAMRGAANGNAKLSDADVAALRAARVDGERYVDMARRYGISARHAARIAKGMYR